MAKPKRTRNKTIPAAELLPAPVSDAVIDEVLAEVVSLHRTATIELSIRIATVVVGRFYGGSIAEWRSRGTRDLSYRKLADRIEGAGYPGLSATSLHRAIAVYELDARIGLLGRPQLNVSHARAVLGLPDAHQERLLGLAEARDWTADRLLKEADKLRDKQNKGRGRKPLPAFVKTTNRFERLLADESAFADLEKVDDLDDDEVQRIAETMVGVRAVCDAVDEALRKRKKK